MTQPNQDTESASRARERERIAFLTIAITLAARGGAFSSTLLVVPLALRHLGAERFGLWMTMSSFANLLAFADLGFGGGLMTLLAEAKGRGDLSAIRRYLVAGFTALGTLALTASTAFALAYPWLDLESILSVHSPPLRQEAGTALYVTGLFAALNIVSSAVPRALLGLQRGARASAWQLAGTVLALATTWFVVQLGAGVAAMVAAFSGAPIAVQCVNGIMLVRRRDFTSVRETLRRDDLARLTRLASGFFILQVGAAVSSSADSILVLHLLGAEAVAAYSVVAKLYGFIGLGLAIFLAPLWPAYGEALASGDSDWVKRTLMRSLTMACSAAACAVLCLTLFGKQILQLWVPDAPTPPRLLLLGLGLSSIMEAGGVAVAMLLNGAAVIRPQLIQAVAFIVLSIGMRVVFIRTLGIAGAAWGNALAYFATMVVPYVALVPRLFRAGRFGTVQLG